MKRKNDRTTEKMASRSFIRRSVIPALLFVFLGIYLPHIIRFILDQERIASPTNRLILLLIQGSLILTGGLILFKRGPGFTFKRFFFMGAAIVISAFLLESALQVANLVFHFKVSDTQRYLRLPVYKNQDWARSMFKELDSLDFDFQPFTLWKRQKFTGKYINIDGEGIRKTWNPPPDDNTDFRKIYMFGGSALWGTGARDDYTIPSCLSRKLHEQGIPCVVTNYGESGYIFNQEIVRLLNLLRSGHRPDVVLFYDGFNDMFSALTTGKPGTVHNLPDLAGRYEKGVAALFITDILRFFKNKSLLYSAVTRLVSLVSKKPKSDDSNLEKRSERLQVLGEGMQRDYLDGMELVKNLSTSYGFSFFCFWQPVLFTETELLAGEDKCDPRQNDPVFKEFYLQMDKLLSRESNPRLISLAGVLSGREHPVYLDLCHVTEEGNEMVASKITEILKRKIFSSNTDTELE